MTWKDLKDRTLFGFPAEKRAFLAKSADTYLKDAQEDFVLHTKCLEFTFQTSLSAGNYSIELPETFLQIQRVAWEGSLLHTIPVWADIQLKDTTETWAKGSPESYFIQGTTIYIYPAPTHAGELTIWCEGVFGSGLDNTWDSISTSNWEAYATKYASSIESPYIPFEYHKYLVDYARSQIHMDSNQIDVAEKYMGKYVVNREEVRKIYLRRKVPVKGRVYDAVDSQITHREII